MKFYTFGNEHKPVVIMLAGSFCPSEGLEYLYGALSEEYYIIVPEYNGHYENSTFTTRKNEAREIYGYLKRNGIFSVRMIYGQSMGAEIGIELLHILAKKGVYTGSAFFDGAPCIRLSPAYRAFMYFKFRTLVNMMKTRSAEEVMSWKFLNMFTNGDTESLRPLFEPLMKLAPIISDTTVKNETTCCYTFDFPLIPKGIQRKMYFFYAKDEKAYKTCYKKVKKAYPQARYKIVNGYGHLTYSIKNKDEYIETLKKILSKG